jgi:branched-chain amino acid transport system permease protein
MVDKLRLRYVIAFIILILLLLLPLFTSSYITRLFTHIIMYAVLAEATNMIMGFTGLVPFGNVVFFGIGAYVTGILMNMGYGFVLSFLGGGLVCIVIPIVIGHPILKMKGHYFAIATMGISEAIKQITTNLEITGGGSGLSLPQLNVIDVATAYNFFYYSMLFMLLITIGMTIYIVNSRLGYGLRAIQASEDGAKSIGVNAPKYKIIIWSLSAFFTGLTGGLFAFWMTYIDPNSVFDIVISVKFIIMILIGGTGTVLGPVIGAFFIESISELVWSNFLLYHLAILGFIIVLVIIFMPKGLTWFYRKRFTLSALLENVKEGKV